MTCLHGCVAPPPGRGGEGLTSTCKLLISVLLLQLWAETMTVKIILPELVTNVKATVPFEVWLAAVNH